jgi:hypothetical protein
VPAAFVGVRQDPRFGASLAASNAKKLGDQASAEPLPPEVRGDAYFIDEQLRRLVGVDVVHGAVAMPMITSLYAGASSFDDHPTRFGPCHHSHNTATKPRENARGMKHRMAHSSIQIAARRERPPRVPIRMAQAIEDGMG